jgi:hypothetical protein
MSTCECATWYPHYKSKTKCSRVVICGKDRETAVDILMAAKSNTPHNVGQAFELIGAGVGGVGLGVAALGHASGIVGIALSLCAFKYAAHTNLEENRIDALVIAINRRCKDDSGCACVEVVEKYVSASRSGRGGAGYTYASVQCCPGFGTYKWSGTA